MGTAHTTHHHLPALAIPGAAVPDLLFTSPTDVLYLTRRFMGFHIIKHYYVMRQYKESSGVVLDFLQFLRSATSLPADFTAQLDAAIEVGRASTLTSTAAALHTVMCMGKRCIAAVSCVVLTGSMEQVLQQLTQHICLAVLRLLPDATTRHPHPCLHCPDPPSPTRCHVQVAQEGCEQLPHIMRIIRQPDVLNEAYSFRYPLRPWPLCQVPQLTEVSTEALGAFKTHVHTYRAMSPTSLPCARAVSRLILWTACAHGPDTP